MISRSTATRSHEIRPLTGIRGVAALWVVGFHLSGPFFLLLPSFDFLAPFLKIGYRGVDLFFILSGLILCYVYSSGTASLSFNIYKNFLWFRFARTYPNHLATLLLMLGLVSFAHICKMPITGNYQLKTLVPQLLMLHAWPFINGGEWNSPAWSISAEWFAYLFIFPIAWSFLGRHRLSRHSGIGIVLLLISWLVIEYSFFGGTVGFSPTLSVVRVSFEFAIGALLFALHDNGHRIVDFCQRFLTYLVVFLLVLIFMLPSLISKGLVILFMPLILLGLTRETSFVAKMLSRRPMIWLGNISYAIYMIHMVSWQGLKRILPAEHYLDSPFFIRIGLVGLYFAVILISAALLYYFIEQPSRNWLRQLSRQIKDRHGKSSDIQPVESANTIS